MRRDGRCQRGQENRTAHNDRKAHELGDCKDRLHGRAFADAEDVNQSQQSNHKRAEKLLLQRTEWNES